MSYEIEGSLLGPKTIQVRLNNGGVRTLHGERVFLNLGTHMALPDIPRPARRSRSRTLRRSNSIRTWQAQARRSSRTGAGGSNPEIRRCRKKLKTEAEFNRRSLESKVRKEEAEARLKEIEVLRAEMAFLKELKDLKIVVRTESDGKWTVLPAPQGCDLVELIDSRVTEPPQLGAPKGLANHRASLDLTRADLAAMAGLSESTVARLEGRAWWKISNITHEKIVKTLNKVRERRKLVPLGLKEVFPEGD